MVRSFPEEPCSYQRKLHSLRKVASTELVGIVRGFRSVSHHDPRAGTSSFMGLNYKTIGGFRSLEGDLSGVPVLRVWRFSVRH